MPIEFGTWIGIRTVIIHIFIPIWPQVIRKSLCTMDHGFRMNFGEQTNYHDQQIEDVSLETTEAENVLRFPRPQCSMKFIQFGHLGRTHCWRLEFPTGKHIEAGSWRKNRRHAELLKRRGVLQSPTAEHQSPESNSLQRAVRLTDWHSQQQVGYRWWVSTSELIN